MLYFRFCSLLNDSMKPGNLKSPFTWNERCVLIQDRVWYLPVRCENEEKFSFPGWTSPLIFEQERPICIEYCSGNGDWIAAKAQDYPEYNWVAVEHNFDRVRKIWAKLKNFSLTNLFIVCGEGFNLTKQYLPSTSVQAVYINFPDPWPKKRHAKHRLVQEPFIKEIERILQPGGVLSMVTDDVPYSKIMIEVLHQFAGFQSLFTEPYYSNEYPAYGSSYFHDLWRQKGKIIRYHLFGKFVVDFQSIKFNYNDKLITKI